MTFVAYITPEYDAMKQSLRQANSSASGGATANAGTVVFLLNLSILRQPKNILALQVSSIFMQTKTTRM